MPDRLRRAAEEARGFMPSDEGLALYEAAMSLVVPGPLLEVGSYCGKSAIYLGAAAQSLGRVLFANSITLTPGTVSIRLSGGEGEVHALTREAPVDLAGGEMGRRVAELAR